jgi:hypothetical protein
MKKFLLLLTPLVILITACGPSSSPAAKAYLNMHKAFCDTGDLSSAKQFASKRSQLALDLGQVMIAAANSQQLQDEMAKDCQNPPKVVSDIEVNQFRHIIQVVNYTGEQKEIVVIQEGRDWKVALNGN